MMAAYYPLPAIQAWLDPTRLPSFIPIDPTTVTFNKAAYGFAIVPQDEFTFGNIQDLVVTINGKHLEYNTAAATYSATGYANIKQIMKFYLYVFLLMK